MMSKHSGYLRSARRLAAHSIANPKAALRRARHVARLLRTHSLREITLLVRFALQEEGPIAGPYKTYFEDPRPADESGHHVSTYNAGRKYRFVPREELDRTAQAYIDARASRGPAEIAVFTAISGDYDDLPFHEHLDPGIDYYAFLEDAPPRPYVYNVEPLPYYDADPVRRARFVKTHAHLLLPQYKIAVWIDGNILIRGSLAGEIERFAASGHPIAAIPHPRRTSVYQEARACMRLRKDDQLSILRQIERYRKAGFDCDDLIESNLMMFRLDHPKLGPVLNAWWREIESGSRRDQLSFNYAVAENDAEWLPICEPPDSVRNHPRLALLQHGMRRKLPPPVVSLRADGETRAAPAAAQPRSWDKSVDVIVCVHNALRATQECLASVAATLTPSRHRLVVVDDGSASETAEWLRSFAAGRPDVVLVRHATAGGYTKAANAGLRQLQADVAIMLNSDTIVADNWIEKLVDAMFSNPGVGIVGPLSNAASHQSVPEHRSANDQTAINDLPPGYSVADMNRWCEANAGEAPVIRVPLVHGFCFAIRSDVVQALQSFDEASFPSGYGEENDYCLRATNAGYGLAVDTRTFVYHEKSQSYQNARRIALSRAGNAKLRALHGDERVTRAVQNMATHPALVRMRSLALALFPPETAVRRSA